MQRTTTTKSVPEEWTKYFVNNVECKRNEIYQTILDNKFFNGQVELKKKYHFQSSEKKVETERDDSCYYINSKTTTLINRQSRNRSVNFSLNTKQFAEKCSPSNEKYKTLIKKMTHILDVFYEADDYQKHSKKLRGAIRDCMGYSIANAGDYTKPYHGILYELSVEQYVLLFDMLALFLIKCINDKNIPAEMKKPNLTFDMSCIKEKWDDNLSNDKKSQFLKKYLAVMSKQADIVFQMLKKNGFLSDKATVLEVENKFNDFKKLIKALEEKRSSLDEIYSLSLRSKTYSFFHAGQDSKKEEKLIVEKRCKK